MKFPILPILVAALMLANTTIAAESKVPGVKQLRQELEVLKKLYEKKIEDLEERLLAIEDATDEVNEKTDELAIEVSQQGNQQAANTFNPGVGVVLNGKISSQSPKGFDFSLPGFFPAGEIGPGAKGLSLGETELNLSSNIDDKFYGSVTLSFGDGEANVEEAFMQTIGLGNGSSIKFGRFFSNIGYLARRHTHTDDFSERPLPYEAFLGGQFGDDGVQFNWLAPTDLFWESGVEIYRGDSFPAAGATHQGAGVWTAYSHIGGDINDSQSWRVGLSFLDAKVLDRTSADAERFSGDSKLWITDLVWKWAPNGNASIQNAKIQAEYFSRNEDGDFTDVNDLESAYKGDQTGWYVQGVYQFMPQWRVGLRYARLDSDNLPLAFNGTVLDNLRLTPERTSLMLDWSNSEFSRIRLQYSRDQSGLTDADIWTLQYISAFGAHGAHSF